MNKPPEKSTDRSSGKSPNRSSGKPSRRPSRPTPHRNRSEPSEGPILIYGLHIVEAAFANPDRKRHRLVATRNALQRLEERGVVVDVPVDLVDPRFIACQLPRDAVHQGVLLQVDPLPAYDLQSLGEARLVLALDQVTDPHNVGAILRSAVALGADAVVTTYRHAPEEGAVLAKSASGALDMVRNLKVRNMAKFVTEAGEAGFTRVALDSDGPASLEETDLGEKLILVLGAEGKGARQGVREACDTLARLDMPGKIRSLNVSNAAVLALYIARGKLGL
ncbi:RNA methyltransferase [Breoghania sp.]|uniref:TrmH family RNA methyltransferase n=1 Tax=Breoghania sp. TaxID=2065378 RepID=UPI0026046E83|nr:RNA methyltransferase [Breoghania sp.]MDJ0933729.1 RNA methyltransferase [Breoghania sp.]